MNRRRSFTQAAFMIGFLLAVACQVSGAASRYSLKFHGSSSGGSLIIGRMRFHGISYVFIETSPGESAISVAKHLANQIIRNHADKDLSDMHKLWFGRGIPASGSSVALLRPLSAYYLAGTERGLGIPEPPKSLTCAYEERSDMVRTTWQNPAEGYDQIFVTLEWDRGMQSTMRTISGKAASFAIDLNRIQGDVNDLYIAVVGLRDRIVSVPAAMHVNRHYQDEAFDIPFARGIMPNWSPWCASGATQSREPGRNTVTNPGCKSCFRSGGKKLADVRSYIARMGLDAKPIYQLIAADPNGPVGIYRKFLGLTSGHTYRITAALSTLQMHTVDADWSLSLCAAQNEPSGKNLTTEQLSGKAPLPNGEVGAHAGRIALFSKGGRMTGPSFRLIKGNSRGQESDKEHMDVTLPPGVETLTVWVRFECSDPTGEVGFMGVGIEDITASKSKAEIAR